jgi:hypothetical protein
MPPMDVLQARIALLERRLQFVADEVSVALARIALAADGAAANGGEQRYPSTLSFDADSLSPFALGFYEREYDSDSKAFRWTGNGPICELRFHLDRGEDRAFRMAVGTTPEDILAQVNGFVDYAPVPLALEEDGPHRLVTGSIPKRQHARLAVVSFLLGREVPQRTEANGAEDHAEDQWLGFRFYAFSVG